MADDVEIGIDGSAAESGVKKILASLDRVGDKSQELAKNVGNSFQKMYDGMKSLGDSSVVSKYEKMTGSMSRAAVAAQKTSGMMTKSITADATKSAAAIDRMTSSLARLESFKGPSKASVQNVSTLLGTLSGMKVPAGLGRLSVLNDLANFKGPSGASVENTKQLLNALGSTKISSTLGHLNNLGALANFKGPSARSVDNTERLFQVLQGAKFRTGSLSEATSLLTALGSAGGRLGGTAARANAASGALTRLNSSSRQGASGLAALASQADKTNQALYHTERFFGTLANVAGLSFIAGEIQKFDSSSAAIQTVTNNLAATAQEMGFLTKAAKDNGTYLGSLTKGYSSFRTAASGAGLALKDTQSLFYGVTQASRVYNLSMDDQEGVYRALTQIMGKNSLQQEELRGQLGDRMPVAIQAMARALGVTIPVMNEMTKKGQVSGKVLTDAFAKLGPILQDMTKGGFTAAMDTIGAKTSQLRTEALLLSVAMGEGGLKVAITNVLSAFTDLIREGGGVYNFLMITAGAAKTLSENLGAAMLIGVIALSGKFNVFGKVLETARNSMAQLAVVSTAATAPTVTLSAGYQSLSARILAAHEAQLIAKGGTQTSTVSIQALNAALAAHAKSAAGSAAANRLLAVSMEAVTGSAALAALGVSSTVVATTTLQRVASGKMLTTMSSAFGILGKAAGMAGKGLSAVLSIVGLTNPYLIGAAAIIGLMTAFANMTQAAKDAAEAEKLLKQATDLASSSAFAGAANLTLYTQGLTAMGAEARKTTIDLENQARAMARLQTSKARAQLQDFSRTEEFKTLSQPEQDAVRGAISSTSYRDTRAFAQSAGNAIKPREQSSPGFLGAVMESARTNRGIGDIMDRRRNYSQATDALSTIVTSTTADVQGLAQSMARAGRTMADIEQATGLTTIELNSMGVAWGVAGEQASTASAKGAKGAKGTQDRVVALTMSLQDYVKNLDSVREAQGLLDAVSTPSGEDNLVNVSSYSAIQDRIQALTLEREALKLGQDTWERYRQSIAPNARRQMESNLADQIASERKKGVTGSTAQEIFGYAQSGVQTQWDAGAVQSAPVGAERTKALKALYDEYNNLGSAMQEYNQRNYLIGQSELSAEQQTQALTDSRRSLLLQYQSELGVQGQLLAAQDQMTRATRNLDQLSDKMDLDVTDAKVEVLQKYAQALRDISESTPEGRVLGQLRDDLTEVARSAAASLDALGNTSTYMNRFRTEVLRPQLLAKNGYVEGGNSDVNALATRQTNQQIDAQAQAAAMQQSLDQWTKYTDAVSNSLDMVGDAFSELLMTGTLDIQALGANIFNEMTKALFIQPMIDRAKASLSGMMAEGGLAKFFGAANTAASAATSLAGKSAEATAVATAVGTSTLTALAPVASTLASSGLAVTGSAAALGGAATGLGASAWALSSAAAALTAAGAASGGSSLVNGVFSLGAKLASGGMMHTGGIVARGGPSLSSIADAARYHNGGIAGLKPREVNTVLEIGEEVLPASSPRHINNIGKFDGPASYGAQGTTVARGGDTYEISLTVQAPTPSGNAKADSSAQQQTAKLAADALDSMMKNKVNSSKRARSMEVK